MEYRYFAHIDNGWATYDRPGSLFRERVDEPGPAGRGEFRDGVWRQCVLLQFVRRGQHPHHLHEVTAAHAETCQRNRVHRDRDHTFIPVDTAYVDRVVERNRCRRG
ncbi:hypothetical protein JOF53_006913 [Crossiella equi]|uniref:Uncharacterized protein n=1 Tax=Crossiella equi TaxID=130796 RepID=A0ABS5ANQ0_9PSEU|nr:hypothetical protein [Crossiella equi]MBP2478041.1 hypothetical protein [Crossiella equi]